MNDKVVGGIYYFKAYQTYVQKEAYKFYIYICDFSGKPSFFKLNSKHYGEPENNIIYRKDNYPSITSITRDSFIDCRQIHKRLISSDNFNRLPDDSYRGRLNKDDLLAIIELVRRIKTLAPNEKTIIINSISASLS